LRELATGSSGPLSISVAPAGRPAIRAGSARGVAPAQAQLTTRSGGTLGLLSVSVTDARDLARTVRGRTRRELLVLRDGRAVASTVPGVRSAPDGSADFEAAGDEYRGRREKVGRDEELVVFTDASDMNEAISRNRLLVIGLLLAFLVLALASTVFLSRALQAQIGQFLDAARRLAGGRFDDPVPVEGHDEFAQLGREFNSMSQQLEGQIEEVQRKHRELETAIRRVGQASAAGLDRQGVFDLAVQNAVQACEAESGRAVPTDLAALENATAGPQEAELAAALAAAESLATDGYGPHIAEIDGVHGIALTLGSRAGTRHLGMISLARRGRAFSSDESDLLEYLAGQAVISIENAVLHEMVQRQAITDELTGLSNVRRMHEALDREFERGRRFNTPVGLVLLDLDDFKGVNDTHGHLQGDEVLSEVAGVLRELSRDIDVPARYGGEELAVVLPQTEIEGAVNLAERMREAIEALRIPRLDGKGDLRVTASFGVASVPSSASDKGSLVAATDAALYRAKRAGKNRVERAEAVTA
jgi:diguanylate cyclase (GGDEF)-like protein